MLVERLWQPPSSDKTLGCVLGFWGFRGRNAREVVIDHLSTTDVVSRMTYDRPEESWGKLRGTGSEGPVELVPAIPRSGEDRLFLVNDVTVVGGSGIMFRNGTAIWQQALFPSNQIATYQNDSILSEFTGGTVTIRKFEKFSRGRRIGFALSLLDSLSDHFGHFVFGAVPKLRALAREIPTTGIKVLVDKDLPQHFIDLIKIYFPQVLIVRVSRGEPLKVDSLLIPETLKWFPDGLPGESQIAGNERALRIPEFDFIDSRLSNFPQSQEIGDVRILRAGTGESNWRKLLNHDELSGLLDRQGFTPLEPLLRRPEELIRQLRKASHIVTDDGSVGANLLLAGVTGKRITVLVHPGMGDFQQWWLPGYLTILGNDVEVIKGFSQRSDSKFSDWSIPTDVVQHSLNR